MQRSGTTSPESTHMPNQTNDSEDYLEFSSISTFIKRFFQHLFWLWAYLLLVLRKNIPLIATGLVIGLLLGAAYFYSKPRLYTSSMVVQFNELQKRTYAQMLENLNTLAGSGAVEQVAAECSISKEAAAGLAGVEGKDFNDEPLFKDTTSRAHQPLKINVVLSSTDRVKEIEGGVVNYLNNSPYLKRLREVQTGLFKEKIAWIDGQLAKLDSLKTEYNKFIGASKSSGALYSNAFDPANVYEQSANLYAQRQNLIRWLEVDNYSITVIDGIKAAGSPSAGVLWKPLLLFGTAGFLIAFLFAFLKETRRRLS